jgi:hypothetical protein
MRLFIFGAGSTLGTLGLPGVGGFGKRVKDEVPNWRAELGALASVVDALEPAHRRTEDDWDLDAAWTHVDYVAKLKLALGTAEFPASASAGLHAAVTAVLRTVDVGRVRGAYDANKDFTLRSEVDRVEAGDVVASFNWDILVEALLAHRLKTRTTLRLVQTPFPHLNGEVRFAKPHGSLAWNRHHLASIDDGSGGPKLGPIPTWKQVYDSHTESNNALKIEPFLLGAVPIKSELIAEVGDPHQLRPQQQLVMAQWAELLRGIREAEEVCVVGYSFPREDGYGRFLMRQAARARTHRIRVVDLYEVASKFDEVRNSIVEVLGVSPSDIASRGAVSSIPCP